MTALFLVLVSVLLLAGILRVMTVTGYEFIWIALGLWAAAAILILSFQMWWRVKAMKERLDQMEAALRRIEKKLEQKAEEPKSAD